MVVFCVISLNSVTFGVHCVKVVEDIPKLLQRKCSPKLLVLEIYHLRWYDTGNPSIKGIKCRRGSQI